MRHRLFLILAAVLIIGVVAWSNYSQQSKVTKTWEYMVISDYGYSSPDGAKELNPLGAQGWELVAVSDRAADQGNQTSTRFVLKRSR